MDWIKPDSAYRLLGRFVKNRDSIANLKDMTTATKKTTTQVKNDNFFLPAENTKPYFKAALEGFAGSGKTYTAALIARGLHQRIKSKKSVIIFDTEKSAKFLKPIFAEAKIKVLVRESRSLADLKETMKRMEEGAGDILIIDSISHIWENFLEAYKQKTHHTFLQFQDWGIIKPTWKQEFSDPFVNDPFHIIMCGRAGYEYENEINPETHKREIYKSGVKMKVEGETAYEPDLLLLMERFEEVIGKDEKKVWREATVLKDRAALLDGKTFKNPSYEDFAPTVEAMLENPFDKKAVITPEGDTALLFKTEEGKAEFRKERDKWLEEIDGLLIRVAPASNGKDRQFKMDTLYNVFGTTSKTAIEGLMPEQLREGYKKIMDLIVKAGLGEYVKKENQTILMLKTKQEK